MGYTDEQYKNAETFILANLDNPSYIAQVAADLGISLADITDVVQRVDPKATESQVEQYFDKNNVDFDRPYEAGIYSFETKEDRDDYLSSGDPALQYYNAALTGQPVDMSAGATSQPTVTASTTTGATSQPPYSIKSLADISKLAPTELASVRDFISNLYNTGGVGINAGEAKAIQDRAAALGVDPSMINDLVSTAYKGFGGNAYSLDDISQLLSGQGTILSDLQKQRIDAAKGGTSAGGYSGGKGFDFVGENTGLRDPYVPFAGQMLGRVSALMAERAGEGYEAPEFGATHAGGYGTETANTLKDLQALREKAMGTGEGQTMAHQPYQYSFAPKKAASGGIMSLVDHYDAGGTVDVGGVTNQTYANQTVPSTFTAPTGFTSNTYSSGYTTPTDIYEGPGVAGITTGTFNPTQRDSYMSTFMSGVTDPQIREAKRQAELARQSQAAKFAQAGAFGGSGRILAEQAIGRNLATQVGDIYGAGQQKAFENAQQQFERDQARNLQAQIATEQARQVAGQQALSGAQTAAQLGLDASKLTEQSKQFGANYGLQTAQSAAQYDQLARDLQQRAEEAQARGDQFAANLALQQLQEAQRSAEATRAFEYQQSRDKYLDPYREAGYMSQILSTLPIKAGETGISPSADALKALLATSGVLFPGG
jgi:hypothetical protein